MKPVLLILSLLLSLLSEGREVRSAVSSNTKAISCISDTASAAQTDDSRGREFCITAVQGYTFAGNENSHSVSLRSFQTGRRSSPQAKSSTRIVKSGRIIDNKNLHPCLVMSYRLMTGLVFSQKYLHIICRLRI